MSKAEDTLEESNSMEKWDQDINSLQRKKNGRRLLPRIQKVGKKASFPHLQSKITMQGYPGGVVVKNPPANAGDMGSSPGPGRSHMPWSN